MSLSVPLVCPRDALRLRAAGDLLECESGHSYAIRDGVPILLLDDVEPTQPGYWALGDEVYAELAHESPQPGDVHPYVRALLRGTCGNLYGSVDIDRYPIPVFPLSAGHGRLLDIGSNWGRWCIAAARLGYSAVGIDPALGAVLAARSVAADLGVDADYVVADGRHLPFPDASFDVVFSYGVLQHFSPEAALASIHEATRVLVPGGTLLLQMPNRYGLLNVFRQAMKGFREAGGFDVRYWSPRVLLDEFEAAVGPSRLEVDGFFSLNAQVSDLMLLRLRHRAVVRVSAALRDLSRWIPWLVYAADSFYIRGTKTRR